MTEKEKEVINWAKDIVSGNRMGSKESNKKLALLIKMAERNNIKNKSIILLKE